MIRRLRGEFIRIAMLAVTLVLLLLTVSVNAVNYISVSRQQDRTLEMIVSHQGTIPAMPKEAKSGPRPNGHFSPETPYDTRFFVLRYTDSGDLTQSDLTHIASVTEADTEPYLQAALSHGEGSGWQSGYRFRVVQTGENRWMAVFLDCRKEVRSLYRLAGVSVAAMAVCVALVYLIVVRLSRRPWSRWCSPSSGRSSSSPMPGMSSRPPSPSLPPACGCWRWRWGSRSGWRRHRTRRNG